jgi:uncharacterized DUF497 family protein
VTLTFEWDPEKAAQNLRHHGVSFDEASRAFRDPLSRTIHDPDHSEDEDRFLLLGESGSGRLLVVAYTERGGRIRIISARVAGRRERKTYQEVPG